MYINLNDPSSIIFNKLYTNSFCTEIRCIFLSFHWAQNILGIYPYNFESFDFFKLTNVAVVNCMSELVSNNLEVANIIVDIIALADMETQVIKPA